MSTGGWEMEIACSTAEAASLLATPATYRDPGLVDAIGVLLRREAPIQYVQRDDYRPFHVLARHADVMEVETHHQQWRNAEMPALLPSSLLEDRARRGQDLRTLVHLDDPAHQQQRSLVAASFLPRSLRRMDDRLAELARGSVDRMIELGGECDFANQIAFPFPLQVILSMLGLPDDDFPLMLRLTQEFFGSEDPDMAREGRPSKNEILQDFFDYYRGVIDDRRACPRDDLATVIATSTIDGEPNGLVEMLSHYFIISTAGHDTTSASLAGGLQALIEHPDQLERIQRDPSLVPGAVNEILRWVTPVKHFARTAAEPYELSGYSFSPGDIVMMAYPSANRDDEVFDDPFRFDVARSPNRHLSFGFGIHHCLGSTLAQLELRAFFGELLPRLRSIELLEAPSYAESIMVSGPKNLRIRYEVAPV